MNEPAASGYRVTDEAIVVTGYSEDRSDVFFDGQHVWSFEVNGREQIPWPVSMRIWLKGSTRLEIRSEHGTRFDRELTFGEPEGDERIRFVDENGIGVHIDKWGLVQRPFSGRGADVISAMVATARKVIDVCHDTVGVQPWLAFGTLLGAVRSGGVIGHDSDIDLAYLSTSSDPVELNLEMFALARALRSAGLSVVNKNGSFLTVLFSGPDGANCSIDLYTCFYLDDILLESATVRTVVPRSAVEPLGTLEFEGESLSAPADPEALLAVSYGPGWRVPDPSFRHEPGRDVIDRFDGWFGSLMKSRREWERAHRSTPAADLQQPTAMGRWALEERGDRNAFIDLGAGVGADCIAAGRAGMDAVSVEYARGTYRGAHAIAKKERLQVRFRFINFYEHRDVLSGLSLLCRMTDGPRVVLAAGLHESLEPRARESFYRTFTTLIRNGGVGFLDHAVDTTNWRSGPRAGGRRFTIDTADLVSELTRRGAVVGETVEEPEDSYGVRRVRMRVEGSQS